MAYDYARRQEIARALGYPNEKAMRRAPAAERARRREQLERQGLIAKGAAQRQRATARKATAAPAAARKRRIPMPGGGGEVVRTTRDNEIAAAIRRADENGERVAFLVTVLDPETGELRTIDLASGSDAGYLSAQLDAFGGDARALVLYLLGGVKAKTGSGRVAANITEPSQIVSVVVRTGTAVEARAA